MNLLAQAILTRQQGVRECVSTVRVVALQQQGDDSTPRHVVTLQIAQLKAGVTSCVDDSTLTPLPVSLAQARLRTLVYVRQRLAAGDVLESQTGFDELADQLLSVAAVGQPRSDGPSWPESRIQAAALPVLCAKLGELAWGALDARQRARLVWRLAEYVDLLRAGAAQQLLYRQVPRLVELLETGDDLLDYCLAYLMGRLGDSGAAIAMQVLAERGRSEATRDIARQAWLALLAPQDRASTLSEHRARWTQLLESIHAMTPEGGVDTRPQKIMQP